MITILALLAGFALGVYLSPRLRSLWARYGPPPRPKPPQGGAGNG